MKNKFNKIRIIQIVLILIIFIMASYYLTKADSAYEIKMSGENIVSKNSEDTLDLEKSFKNNNIANIHYDIYKDNEQILEGNFKADLIDVNGNILNLPYVYVEQSGFNLNEFDVYIDGNKLRTLINDNETKIIKEFYIDFYAYYIEDDGQEVTKIPLNCKRKIILDFKETNPSTENLGNFNLKPKTFYDNNVGLTNLTNLKLNSYNANTNTYNYDLDIKVGSKEKIKQYIFDIDMLSEIFPNGNIMNISNVEITPKIQNQFIDIKYDNKIKDYLGNSIKLNNNSLKNFIITIERKDNNRISTKNEYSIVLNSLNDNNNIQIKLNLTINLTMDDYDSNNGYRFVYESKDNEIINKILGESDLNISLDYNKAPSNFKVFDFNGNDVTTSDFIEFENSSLNEYLTYNKDIYNKTFKFKNSTPEGFYTIETYEPTSKISGSDGQIDEEATLRTQVRTTCYTFYISKAQDNDISLNVFDNGKAINIENKEFTITVPTDNNGSLNTFALSPNLSNGINIIDNNFTYKFVENLEDMKEISSIVITNENIMNIYGNINLDKFYLLLYPKTTQSYYIYTVNILHKGLKDLVVDLEISTDVFTIPSKNNIESANLKPIIKVDGVNSDIKNYNYDYKFYQLLNGKYQEFNNENIYIEKGIEESIGKDTLYISDFAPKGNFMIECYIKDKDASPANKYFTINYEGNIKNEYKIEFLNENNKVEVPSKDGKINRISLQTKVLKEGIETSIKPIYSVSGDTKVSIKNNTLIIKSGATIGNTVIVKAELINPDGDIICTESKSFILVKEGESSGGDIIDDPDKDDGKESKVPTSIVLSGFETEGTTNYLKFNKTSGEQKTLTYTCYDKDGNIITNPSISISFDATKTTGFSAKSDYKNKQIIISSNGLFEDRILSIEFKNGEDVIKAYTLNLMKPGLYECTLEILQKDIIRNGKITAKATFKNNSLVEMKVLLAIVCYDKDDSMVSYVQTPTTIKSGAETKEDSPLEAKLTVPEDSRDLVIKAFLLDGSSLENSTGYYRNPIIITNREDY